MSYNTTVPMMMINLNPCANVADTDFSKFMSCCTAARAAIPNQEDKKIS
jgi:hypothetical protein